MDRAVAPRGRHAPPLEIRQDRQRRRLFSAAASVFARTGYADASAEAVAREAGMSKATFYEHFRNKEECLLALFDAALEKVIDALDDAHKERSPRRVEATIDALLDVLVDHPDEAQTLLVEVIAAGPRARARRDRAVARLARWLDGANREAAEAGTAPRLVSVHDAYAIVGAIIELAARQLRTGDPADIRELGPVIERLAGGLLAAGEWRRA
jgi:AcrR family transcriptional regulator